MRSGEPYWNLTRVGEIAWHEQLDRRRLVARYEPATWLDAAVFPCRVRTIERTHEDCWLVRDASGLFELRRQYAAPNEPELWFSRETVLANWEPSPEAPAPTTAEKRDAITPSLLRVDGIETLGDGTKVIRARGLIDGKQARVVDVNDKPLVLPSSAKVEHVGPTRPIVDHAQSFAWCERELLVWARDPKWDDPQTLDAITTTRRELRALRIALGLDEAACTKTEPLTVTSLISDAALSAVAYYRPVPWRTATLALAAVFVAVDRLTTQMGLAASRAGLPRRQNALDDERRADQLLDFAIDDQGEL